MFIVHRLARSTFAMAPADRLLDLGQLFAQIGQLPLNDCRLLITEAHLMSLCDDLSRQEALAGVTPGCPAHWQAAFEDYRRIFRQNVIRPDFYLPIEFREPPSIDDGFTKAQAFVRQFGELLTWWPRMWRAATKWVTNTQASHEQNRIEVNDSPH